jgi:DNA-binding NtrC family response regulator
MQTNILVVDDEALQRDILGKFLKSLGSVAVAEAADGPAALQLMEGKPFDIVITDLKMPAMSGLELLSAIKQKHPETSVVILTGHGSAETTVQAIKLGAEDYLIKPFVYDKVREIVERIMQAKDLYRTQGLDLDNGLGQLIGISPVMRNVFKMVLKAGLCDATVLIQGENGTGKELVAQAIHAHGPRADKPFIPIDCGVLNENLIESELFGHMKGAFTGAQRDRDGLLKLAQDGTIFLDEIGDIPPALQTKLLRAIQEREFRPVGSSRTEKFAARIITATNQDLKTAMQQGTFREDLFYRIHVLPIDVPPLRERVEDVPLLVRHFIDEISTTRRVRGISAEAMRALQRYHWPGNVRELENCIERAVNMCDGETIELCDLPAALASPQRKPAGAPADTGVIKPMRDMEKDAIVQALQKTGNDRRQAAAMLKIGLSTLYKKIKYFSIDRQ